MENENKTHEPPETAPAEEKRHLTSAERQELYRRRAASGAAGELSRRRRRKTALILSVIAGILALGALTAAVIVLNQNVWKPRSTYREAEKKFAEGQYLDAYAVFVSLGAYEDAPARAEDCIRENARKLTGRADALTATSAEMPWFSVNEDGVLAFNADNYRGDGHLIIPDILDGRAVLALRDQCFFYADYLLSVELPATVITVGERAFLGCTGLTALTLPDSVQTVGPKAFQGCTALEKITLGTSLRSLGDRAFFECIALSELVLPEGLEAVETRLCNNCISLTAVTLPSTLQRIGTYAFTGCEKLETVTFNGTKEALGALCTAADADILTGCKNVICKQ